MPWPPRSCCFRKFVTALRGQEADAVRRGLPWSPPLEDRALLAAAYWRTNLTLRQLVPLFGVYRAGVRPRVMGST